MTPKGEWKFFVVNIPTDGKYFFTVHQKTKRMYPRNMHDNFKYADVTMLFGQKKGGNSYDYISNLLKGDAEVWVSNEKDKHNLHAG